MNSIFIRNPKQLALNVAVLNKKSLKAKSHLQKKNIKFLFFTLLQNDFIIKYIVNAKLQVCKCL